MTDLFIFLFYGCTIVSAREGRTAASSAIKITWSGFTTSSYAAAACTTGSILFSFATAPDGLGALGFGVALLTCSRSSWRFSSSTES